MAADEDEPAGGARPAAAVPAGRLRGHLPRDGRAAGHDPPARPAAARVPARPARPDAAVERRAHGRRPESSSDGSPRVRSSTSRTRCWARAAAGSGCCTPRSTRCRCGPSCRAARSRPRRGAPQVEIMIPLVGFARGAAAAARAVSTEAVIAEERGDGSSILSGTMIEVPRAALTADEIAAARGLLLVRHQRPDPDHARLLRDDAEGKFLTQLPRGRHPRANPFETIDQDGRRRAGRDRRRTAPAAQARHQAGHLRRARRRPRLGRVLPPGRARLRVVLALPGADRAARGGPGGGRRRRGGGMRIDVAFTPGEPPRRPWPSSIDVLRATTTIAQALAGGYERVLACAGLDRARELRSRLGDGTMLAGERGCVRPEGFDFGNSPREFAEGGPRGSTLVLTTTNGTRAIVAAAGRADTVLVGSLANLTACAAQAARIARAAKGDVLVQCAGVRASSPSTTPTRRAGSWPELPVWLAEWELRRRPGRRGDLRPRSRPRPRGWGVEERPQPARRRPRSTTSATAPVRASWTSCRPSGDVDGDVALITA